jgi:HlyD family secretion protein
MNKKWVTIGVLGVLVLGSGYWGYKHFTAKPAVASTITKTAKMGNVSKVITATGTVNFPRAIPLTFQQPGKIVELNVKVGDLVKAGQVLAKTDDTKLSTAVLQAQASVTSAQAKLQTIKDGFNDQTRSQAQASLAKAKQSVITAQQGVVTGQQNLTTAQQNADPGYLNNQVLLATQAVKQASDALAKAIQSGNASSIQPAQSTLSKASTDLTSAQNVLNGGAAQTLASAQAQIRSAQAQIVSAQADVTSAQYQVNQEAQGPKSGDLQSAQSGIELAQVQLTGAQTDLSNSAIIAPMDAVVVSAPLLMDQQSDAKSIITITPTGNNLQVDASIDQSDITQVKVGQKVDITLDAYPNQHISGTVSLVALQGTIVSNVTTFTVTATVDQASDLLRAGMNANVNIVVAEAKNVLTVPSEAIKGKGNQTGVMVPVTSGTQPKNAGNTGTGNAAAGNTRTGNAGTGNAVANFRYIPVEIGLDDGTNVEIKSGLNEGQEVITGTRSSTTAKTTSGFSLGGGGGNPARAMGGGGGNRGN